MPKSLVKKENKSYEKAVYDVQLKKARVKKLNKKLPVINNQIELQRTKHEIGKLKMEISEQEFLIKKGKELRLDRKKQEQKLAQKPGRKKGKSKIKGVAQAKKIQHKRSQRSRTMDSKKNAKSVVKPTREGIAKWRKSPRRVDIEGVDTKGSR